MTGVLFMSATPKSGGLHDEIEFAGVRLEDSVVENARFSDCLFQRCVLGRTQFRECRFVNCRFQHCDLNLAQFPQSVLSNVSFEDCKVVGVLWIDAQWPTRGTPGLSFLRCQLNSGSFSALRLPKLIARECQARDVDFREADLTGADLRGTDCAESLFAKAILTGADLRNARNYQINPAETAVQNGRFSLPEAMALLYALNIKLDDPA